MVETRPGFRTEQEYDADPARHHRLWDGSVSDSCLWRPCPDHGWTRAVAPWEWETREEYNARKAADFLSIIEATYG